MCCTSWRIDATGAKSAHNTALPRQTKPPGWFSVGCTEPAALSRGLSTRLGFLLYLRDNLHRLPTQKERGSTSEQDTVPVNEGFTDSAAGLRPTELMPKSCSGSCSRAPPTPFPASRDRGGRDLVGSAQQGQCKPGAASPALTRGRRGARGDSQPLLLPRNPVGEKPPAEQQEGNQLAPSCWSRMLGPAREGSCQAIKPRQRSHGDRASSSSHPLPNTWTPGHRCPTAPVPGVKRPKRGLPFPLQFTSTGGEGMHRMSDPGRNGALGTLSAEERKIKD